MDFAALLWKRASGILNIGVPKSRLRKSEQGDKWNFCLTAGKIGPRIRSDDEQTSTPEPHTGLQGEGGACRRQGRPDDSSACRAVRRPPQSDYGVEGAAGGWRFRSFWTWQRCAGHACDRCEVAACQDRGADFFRRSAHQGGIAERKAMIDREHDLSITRQAEILKVSRGSVYYLPRPVSPDDLALMRRLGRVHLEVTFAGSGMCRGLPSAGGVQVGRRTLQ